MSTVKYDEVNDFELITCTKLQFCLNSIRALKLAKLERVRFLSHSIPFPTPLLS